MKWELHSPNPHFKLNFMIVHICDVIKNLSEPSRRYWALLPWYLVDLFKSTHIITIYTVVCISPRVHVWDEYVRVLLFLEGRTVHVAKAGRLPGNGRSPRLQHCLPVNHSVFKSARATSDASHTHTHPNTSAASLPTKTFRGVMYVSDRKGQC